MEAWKRHSVDAGRHGDERSDGWDQAAEENGSPAVPPEPVVGPLDIAGTERQPAAVPPREVLQASETEPFPEVVPEKRAKEGARGAGEHDEGDSELAPGPP